MESFENIIMEMMNKFVTPNYMTAITTIMTTSSQETSLKIKNLFISPPSESKENLSLSQGLTYHQMLMSGSNPKKFLSP